MSFEIDKKRQSKQLTGVRQKRVERAERPGGTKDAKSLLLLAPEILRRVQGLDIPDEDKVVLRFLEHGFTEWMNGTEMDVALCIKKDTGAPKGNGLESLLEFVLPLTLLLDGGMSVEDAKAKIARTEGVSERTVERAWKLAGGLEGYLRRKEGDKK